MVVMVVLSSFFAHNNFHFRPDFVHHRWRGVQSRRNLAAEVAAWKATKSAARAIEGWWRVALAKRELGRLRQERLGM